MSEDLVQFINGEGIDVYASVGIDEIPEPDREHVLDFLPGAQSVIVIGRAVPWEAYRTSRKDQTRVMLQVAESLDRTSARLAEILRSDGHDAIPVPLYLPVTVRNGRVEGLVRLKKIAAAAGLGTQGKNTVLLHPRYGPRLLLSAVVTGLNVTIGETGIPRGGESPVCTGCGRCMQVCPGKAVGPDGVDTFRCRTVRTWVPPVVVPAVKWMLRRKALLRCMAPFAPYIARTATVRCSRCITDCPHFMGMAGVVDDTP